MCGFVAKLTDLLTESNEFDTIRLAIRLLKHRGPDDEAFYVSPRFSAGFRRLKIIDLSDDARQPMRDVSGRYWIVFNGEIYNYRELRKELEQAGFQFWTSSDTEVLLNCFIHWGEECTQRLNGMFAFLIWDQEQQSLFGARDRFGEKPLFWSQRNDRFCFASEIKALFPLLGHVPNANQAVIRNYIQDRQADASEETFYQGINHIPAAHQFVIRDGQMGISRYWQLTASETRCDNAIERFRELFLDSVRLRMRADVPVGTCLSGGLDSGAIASAIPQVVESSARKNFTASYPEFDESQYVDLVNQVTDSQGFSIVPSPSSLQDISQLLRFHDEPFHSFMVFASYQVMKLAREHGVKVLLNGQGADELLAGYSSYMRAYLQDSLSRGSVWAAVHSARNAEPLVKQSAAGTIGGVLKHMLLEQAKRLGFRGSNAQRRRHDQAITTFGLTAEFADATALSRTRSTDDLAGHAGALKNQLNQSLRVAHLPLYLRIEDRNSMANSIESRLPFLDHRLAEFVFSLPTKLFMASGTNKYLLRQATKGILPDEVRLRQDKYGFPVPEVQWLYDRLKPEIEEMIHSPEFASRRHIRSRTAEKKVQQGGRCLAKWRPRFIETRLLVPFDIHRTVVSQSNGICNRSAVGR